MHTRNMEIVCDKDKLDVDIQQVCMSHKTIKKWAYILHDQDDTREHYHIFLHFDSSQDSNLIASWFGVPDNLVNKVKGRVSDMLLYLTHGNVSQQHKHQYSPNEVIANFNFLADIEADRIIGDFENFSYAQQLKYINSLPIDEKTKCYTKLRKLWELHCQVESLKSDRNIQVIFIFGKAQCGKTTYSKLLCEKLGYDYCISSSSNDPFQDYLGQSAFIFDDMRDTTFEHFDDLLKVLDNNTSSSVRSRFNNKVFNGKLIIITTSVPIHYWYRNVGEELKQLYRRISCYVHITNDIIYVYPDGLNEFGKPECKPQIVYNDLKQYFNTNEIKKIDVASVLDSISNDLFSDKISS